MSGHSLSTATFANAARTRERWLLAGAVALTITLGTAYTAFALDSALLPFLLLVTLVLPLALWYSPRAVLYLVFAACCLFELYPSEYKDSLTEQVPIFWNVNTIFQTYAHVDFKAVPFNLIEIVLILAGVFSLLKATFTKTFQLRGGPLLVPVCLYMGFVLWGWINGIATGGDFKLSLQEVRAQLYFGIAYFLAVHLIREQKQIRLLWWLLAVFVSVKGILYTFRRYVTLHGLPLPDQGVGSHEEAFLFVLFALLLLVVSLSGDRSFRAIRQYLLLWLPFVLLGYLATNRRAGTAALLIAVPFMMFAAFCAFPHRRRAIAIAGVVLAVLGPAYYMVFKNSGSAIAQPARAIRSNFQPDERDASSNAYRDAENSNQMATIRLSPLLGYGYGKRMLHAVPIADISGTYEWWDLLPHNQILWVWMRTGTLGFVAFWILMSAAVIRCCQLARDEKATSLARSHAVFCLAATVALLIFGMLDLQLSNFRSMLILGIWLGSLNVCATQEQTA